jgi:PKD repeat protein
MSLIKKVRNHSGLYLLITLIFVSLANAEHFEFSTPSTTSSMGFYGDVFTIDDVTCEVGDEIAVYDQQNTICGHVVITHAGYFNFSVYGDESVTPNDEGASINEDLIFKVWDDSAEIEITLDNTMFIQKQVYTIPQIDTIPPKFLGNNEIRGMGIAAKSPPPAPQISEISPVIAFITGGGTLQITGTNFQEEADVIIDGILMESSRASSTLITCTIPPNDEIGSVDIIVSNPDGLTASTTLQYTYNPPKITEILPAEGSIAGLTVSIIGEYFRENVIVSVAGITATTKFISSTSLQAYFPPYDNEEIVTVIVKNIDDENVAQANFKYIIIPVITEITPNTVSTAGGGTLQIKGNNFDEYASLFINGNRTFSYIESSTLITCDIPASETAGDVFVVVRNSNGYTAAEILTYVFPEPTITEIYPQEQYTSGNVLMITGTNFDQDATISIDGNVINSTWISSSSLTCNVPAHNIGLAELLLSNSDGKSVTYTLNYIYNPPTITQISPLTGSTEGIETMTISGNYFRQGASVIIAGITATINEISTTTIECNIPAYTSAEAVDVVVINDDNSKEIVEKGFTYIFYPKIQSINPQESLIAGGGNLQITGNYFQEGVSVFIDGITVTENRISDTQISCVIPAHDAGDVDIVVKNPDNKSDRIQFTYLTPNPTISQISPDNVYVSGGLTLTITGTSFQEGLSITIDGITVTNTNRISSTSITCTAPAHDIGQALLLLSNPDGKSVTYLLSYVNNPPVISELSPQKFSTEGDSILTITGDYFDLSATVTIDGTSATIQSITVNTIKCDIPFYTNATCTDAMVNIIVKNSDGQEANSTFQYIFIPKIESISPQIVDTTGGGKLTISGINFQDNATVLIDNAEPENISIVSHTQITCNIPTNDVGAVNVVVTNPNNYSSSAILEYEFPAPTITSITPSTVFNTGATELTIIGTNFDLSATVSINEITIASNRLSYTTITCIAPAHEIPDDKRSSKVDVVVFNPNGKSATDELTYEFNPPIISKVSPAIGTSESLTFTIYGDYFREGADVYVGQSIGTVISLTSKTILCNVTDYEEDDLEIEISNKDNKSDSKTFALKFLPLIQNITPQIIYAPMTEIIPITITGAHFEQGLTVTMAGSIITDLTNTDTTITFNAPQFNGYTKTDITVINPDKTLSTKKAAIEYRDVKARLVVSPNTTGKAPYKVLFEDKSEGVKTNIKKWIWQYAEGKTKTTYANSFTYQYNNIGTYQVKMSVVVLSNGHTYTETTAIQTVNVERQDIGLAFDTIGGKVGYPPFTIQVDNQTINADNLNITWTWNFGDGTTSHEKAPSHTYEQPGMYTVTLIADVGNQIKPLQKTNFVTVIAPVPDNRITGRVSFDNGANLPENTWVQAWSPETGDGASVSVDENGYYTIIDLNPDSKYIISVDFKNGQAYYNDTTVYSNSLASAVTPSDGYNISLPSQYYTASGKLIFENGQPVPEIMIEAFSEATGYWTFAISNTRMLNNANFKFTDLIEGTYTINVNVSTDNYKLKNSTPITITVNDANPNVQISDLILLKNTRSIAGTINGVEHETSILVSAFSRSIDFAKAINLTVADSGQYIINDLKPADDYVVQIYSEDYPNIYYDAKNSWFEADWVDVETESATGIDFTLTSYNRSISGVISVPLDAQKGEIIWIDAYSEELEINSSTMVTVDDQCELNGACDYPYTINGLEAGDDFIVVVNSDIYETLYHDNQQSRRDATLIDLISENATDINFELTEGYYIDGTIVKPENINYSDIEIEAWSDDTNSWGFAIPDDNGNFIIEGLSDADDFVVQAIIKNEPPYVYKEGAKHTRDMNVATPVGSIQGGSTPVNIEIVTGYKISGSVKNAAGVGLSNIMIIVENQSENIDVISRTDSYGTYTIKGLPANFSYSVTADPGSTSKYMPKTRTIKSYDFTKDTVLNLELSTGFTVSGTVKYDGTPISGADIFLRSPVTGYDQWTISKLGEFNINGVPSDAVNDYELVVETDLDYLRVIKTISVVSDVDIDITLTLAGRISGTVYNANNEPISNVMIHVYSLERDFQRFDIQTNYKGEYVVNGLPTASDFVVIAIPDNTYAKKTVSGKSTGDTVDFTLDAGGTISGNVQSEDGTKLSGVLVSLNSDSLNIINEMTRTDTNGNYSFDALMNSDANDYIVSIYPSDYPEPKPLTELNIGKTDANFTLSKGNDTTISGTLSNAAGKQIKINVYNSTTYQIAGQSLVASDGTFEIKTLQSGINYVLQFISKDGSVNHFLANENTLSTTYDGTTVPTGEVVNVSL